MNPLYFSLIFHVQYRIKCVSAEDKRESPLKALRRRSILSLGACFEPSINHIQLTGVKVLQGLPRIYSVVTTTTTMTNSVLFAGGQFPFNMSIDIHLGLLHTLSVSMVREQHAQAIMSLLQETPHLKAALSSPWSAAVLYLAPDSPQPPLDFRSARPQPAIRSHTPHKPLPPDASRGKSEKPLWGVDARFLLSNVPSRSCTED